MKCLVLLLASVAMFFSGAGMETGAARASAATSLAYSRRPDWRYARHGGRWWYWTPSNRWVVWLGGRWVPYRVGIFSSRGYGYGRGGYWNGPSRYRMGYRGYGPRPFRGRRY